MAPVGQIAVELPPCPRCGNDFIEIFGGNRTPWWVGCKPCSKAGTADHFRTTTRAEAVSKWNEYVTASKTAE